MRKSKYLVLCALLLVGMLTGCGSKTTTTTDTTKTEVIQEVAQNTLDLEDGVYTVEFTTDSSMFHINEALDNKATLTVKDGQGTAHIVLTSKKIVNLFSGTIDEMGDNPVLLEPTVETVTYSDGTSDEVNAFDVPVPCIGEEFDLALVGTKGTWYDHKVSVSNPVQATVEVGDSIEVTLEGGSGKATIDSPAAIKKTDSGYLLTVTWSSPHYDYMIVGGEKYLPINIEGNSVFEIPVTSFENPLEVIADTTAMSTPHEIEYKIIFNN